MMRFESTFVVLFLIGSIAKSTSYHCNWFGNNTNAPISPIDVCTAYSEENELDGLVTYSTKLQCDSNQQLFQYEWNNTDCDGTPYNTVNIRKDDGYYFNCGAQATCPFTKIIFWKLANITAPEHICAIDTHHYHEFSVVTNICIDMIAEYNMSFHIDCDANSITYSEYTDALCTQPTTVMDHFVIEEGCDDPFDLNAYVQVSECDDANYNPQTTAAPSITLTTLPTTSGVVPSPTNDPTVVSTTNDPTRVMRPTITTSTAAIVTAQTVRPYANVSWTTSRPPTATGKSTSESSSTKVSPWIVIVIFLCVIIVILLLLVFYILVRQKKLKTEVLLNENMNPISITQ